MRKNTADDGEDPLGKFFSAKRACLDKLATLELPKPFVSDQGRLRHLRLFSKLSIVARAIRMETAPSPHARIRR